MSQRREPSIDSTRGIAIALVLLFHLSQTSFPMGFLGVDLFFILSGYFIGKQLFGQSTTVIDYLGQRFWRLAPAMLAMLVVTCALGVWSFAPAELSRLSLDVLPGLAFLANVFPPQGGYFAAEVETNALLHLWSVSVEMQIYLFVAILAATFGRGMLGRSVLVFFAVISFAAWFLTTEAFYESYLRFWQFGIGIGASALPQRFAGRIMWAGSGILTAYVLPEWLFAPAMVFFAAASAVLIINRGNWLLMPLVWMGRRSYGIYLWHWPILVVMLTTFPNGLSLIDKTLVVIASCILAEISWWGFERRRSGTRVAWLVFVKLWLILSLVALTIFLSGGLPQRLSQSGQELLAPSNYSALSSKYCNHLIDNKRGSIEHCSYGEGREDRYIAVLGDSHGAMLASALGRMGAQVEDFSISGCPLSVEIYTADNGYGCAAENRRALSIISRNEQIQEVILYARWSRYLEERFRHPSGAQERLERPQLRGSDMPSKAYREGLLDIVGDLKKSGKRVVLVTQSPIFGFNPRREALRAMLWGGDEVGRNGIERPILDDRFVEMRDFIRELPVDLIIDPMEVFCDDTWCEAASRDGTSLWFADQDHLSVSGGDRLASEILSRLDE